MLSRDQYRLLKMGYKFYAPISDASKKLKISESDVLNLLNDMPDGFIAPDNNAKAFIDDIKGKAAFEEYYERVIMRRHDLIRYCITTAIAIAALLKSFDEELALLWKLLVQ